MRKEVEMSGDRWEAEDSVLFSIYTPIITVSLASKQVRRIDLSYSLSLSSLPLLPFAVPYLLLFCLLASNLCFLCVSDSLVEWHVEGSECCLIHYDNPAPSKGAWMNPNVRVRYKAKGWELVRQGVGWPGKWDRV